MRITGLTGFMACVCLSITTTYAASNMKRYYAHEAVLDEHGVIAPWYKGSNGQLDWRIRIAAETLKRYPWTTAEDSASPLPHYIYSGAWKISPEGEITIPPLSDWANGDWGQRASYVLSGMIDYYRYSGDPAAVAILTLQADAILDHCMTPDDHPWPRFPITVPVKGKPYYQCDPHGWIQLDIVAEVGLPLVKAAQMTGNQRWMDACKHWGDLLAEKRNRQPGLPPWGRYANPQEVPWEDHMTGGVVFILDFFDALIRAGYTGRDNAIVEAREAGVAYLRDVLLPNWTGHDTWGRNYWDWPCPVQVENVTEFAARYLMEHPDEFPNWKLDARNIMTLFLNRTSVAGSAGGDTFSGAWAYPESSGCCGRSFWYGPMELASVYAQYGVLAGSDWGREMARRQIILATYDGHETGVVEDNIDGGPIVAGDWFKIAHPMALKHCLAVIAWMPEVFSPARENHIVRSTGVVTDVQYDAGQVSYVTHDAPKDSVEVLRVAFRPRQVKAGTTTLSARPNLNANGYTERELGQGDWLVTIRHDGETKVTLAGDDPQQQLACGKRSGDGWTYAEADRASHLRPTFSSDLAGAQASYQFTGRQVRVIGHVGPDGGLADVLIDNVRQPVGIDAWNPDSRRGLLYWKNGLSAGEHSITIIVRGMKNPRSTGKRISLDVIQYSDAEPEVQSTHGYGPTDKQRWIFGYAGREGYKDSKGNLWLPGTEFVIRSGSMVDSVASSWWTNRTRLTIDGTEDPELYRHGVHGREFWADFTVGPGTYHARLKFCETRNIEPKQRAITIAINGQELVSNLDLAATASAERKSASQPQRQGDPYVVWGGLNRPVDLVFNGIQPRNGIISIKLSGSQGGEAIVQAIEVGPGDGGEGAAPVTLPPASRPAVSPDGNLLVNGGFEGGITGDLGAFGKTGGNNGWTFVFAGAGNSYIFPESAYAAHPEWGPPEIHSGQQAVRTHTDGGGHTLIYQDVEVKPETTYIASIWVHADDLRGKGFGTHRNDAAGFRIQQLDAAGKVLVDHHRQVIHEAGPFQKLSRTFKTGGDTLKVRFILETIIDCKYDEGHVTYDECMLMEAK